MGKQSRLRKERKTYPSTLKEEGKATLEERKAAIKYFAEMAGELEPLTDQLKVELRDKGWDEDRLREAQTMGLRYSRKSNSFWE